MCTIYSIRRQHVAAAKLTREQTCNAFKLVPSQYTSNTSSKGACNDIYPQSHKHMCAVRSNTAAVLLDRLIVAGRKSHM